MWPYRSRLQTFQSFADGGGGGGGWGGRLSQQLLAGAATWEDAFS